MLSLPEPPAPEAVTAAIQDLTQLGALAPDESLTPLGEHLSLLPLDCRLGKMLIFGALLRCLKPLLTIAASLSVSSPFVAPLERRAEAAAARKALRVGKSDHLTVLRAFHGWLQARQQGHAEESAFLATNFLSRARLLQIEATRSQYLREMQGLGFEEESASVQTHLTGNKLKVVLGAVAAGLYPNVISVRRPERKYIQINDGAVIPRDHTARELKMFTQDDGRVFIHPASVNFDVGEYDSPYLVYLDKVQTSKVFIRDCSQVSPYSLLLFGGAINFDPRNDMLTVDSWIKFQSNGRVGVLVKEIRKALDNILHRKFEDPRLQIHSDPIMDVVTRLIEHDGYR
eukprot:GILI01027856.1.p1 GENE.GILI01027856.1~~GILI01027856.1.p1  ORF type:complete len:343 (+),score=104.72 GILI01027856.1:82-1110(+)